MGSLSTLDFRQRLILPDTPPELVSPSLSANSPRPSPPILQSCPPRLPASPPMSNYDRASGMDRSPGKNVEPQHGRSDSAPHRQQLPSLTSLFGPPSSRPLNSPLSDRHSSYSNTSPLDRPRVSGGDRGSLGSYFSSALSPPVTQPRSTYEGKFETTERSSVPALKRSYSGSASPGYREIHSSRSDSRSDEASSKWSFHQESSRHEYSLGSREDAFQPSRDHFRLQFPGQKEQSPRYGDQRSSGGGSNPPPTPTSTTLSEGLTSKDGLGPKIWTGSHFLPRFVRAAEVPGEGLCYFYDDGTHCKTVIDGEVVNAHWGVTKAGKPRKRLAIACVTCREKKIKCDPDYPRCIQCAKFGRQCRFKNAPRGGNNTSPTTPPADLEDIQKMDVPLRPTEFRLSQSGSSSPVSPAADVVAPSENAIHKRQKVGQHSYVPTGEAVRPTGPVVELPGAKETTPRSLLGGNEFSQEVLSQAWQTDPYVSNPESISSAVTHFFQRIENTMILQLLPKQATMAWISSSANRKSPEDQMVLYSMLCLGVTLSEGPKHIASEYAQVAHYAQKMSTADSLQVVQSRIILAVYYISARQTEAASSMISRAISSSVSLQLNLELNKVGEIDQSRIPMGMTKAGFSEARRRTFWSLFMLERLSGLFPRRPAMIHAEDICLRLPTDKPSFEEQKESQMPMFNPYEGNQCRHTKDEWASAAVAFVEMMNLWAACQAGTLRLSQRETWTGPEMKRLQGLSQSIEEWHSCLPSGLAFSDANIDSTLAAGRLSQFLTMHMLYHHACINLHRHEPAAEKLASDDQIRKVSRCREHAKSILEITRSVGRLGKDAKIASPIVAVMVAEAIDVLSAAGAVSELDKAIGDATMGSATVGAISSVWEGLRTLRDETEARARQLLQIQDKESGSPGSSESYRIVAGSSDGAGENEARWQFLQPLGKLYGREIDILYNSVG